MLQSGRWPRCLRAPPGATPETSRQGHRNFNPPLWGRGRLRSPRRLPRAGWRRWRRTRMRRRGGARRRKGRASRRHPAALRSPPSMPTTRTTPRGHLTRWTSRRRPRPCLQGAASERARGSLGTGTSLPRPGCYAPILSHQGRSHPPREASTARAHWRRGSTWSCPPRPRLWRRTEARATRPRRPSTPFGARPGHCSGRPSCRRRKAARRPRARSKTRNLWAPPPLVGSMECPPHRASVSTTKGSFSIWRTTS
mmetsp:Transcript_38809/g.123282  ORF Transcript_38809/g.123282 Transcript_38809/m.123282 type:complete len:253 (+) Transcript_38809:1283-2041(+)